MSETVITNVQKRASSMEVSPQFDGYSGVRIFTGTDENGNAIVIEAGDTNGRTLEIKNPFGTQAMANNILADIRGYQYQPMSADNAQLNPAAEMGDGVTVNGVYSGIFVRATQFGRLMASNISAPTEEEIEHEFAIESPTDRQYTRFVQQTKAVLKITNEAIEAEVARGDRQDATLALHATEIAAKVTAVDGNNVRNSFAWSLTSAGHYWYANGASQPVMSVTKDGLTVRGNGTFTGIITATGGVIGGFTINANDLRYNNMPWGGTQSTGIYIGTSGIQLGQRFKVDTGGNVTANNMTLTGTLRVGDETISANRLRDGANNGYEWSNGDYGGYNSRAEYSLSGAGGGIGYKLATDNHSGQYPSFFQAYQVVTDDLRIRSGGSFMVHDRFSDGWKTEAWYDRDGGYHFIRYLSS